MRHELEYAAATAATTTMAAETVMQFGSCEVTSTQLRTLGRHDLLSLLLRHGVKRLAAERIVEIHCDSAEVGRARSHPMSRGR